jgi:cation transport ATPase
MGLFTAFPPLLDMAPVGGVSELAGGYDPSLREFEDAFLNDDIEEVQPLTAQEQGISSKFRFADARSLFLSMLGTFLLMLPVSWIYKGIHRDGEHDQSLDETTLILPAVVAGIVMVVQHSLALAFSLAGIVAGVQFRRALSDTFDTLFIFVAIAVGIAAGIKALDIALVLTMFFNFATLIVCLYGDGLESHHEARRKRERRARKEAERLESQGQGPTNP